MDRGQRFDAGFATPRHSESFRDSRGQGNDGQLKPPLWSHRTRFKGRRGRLDNGMFRQTNEGRPAWLRKRPQSRNRVKRACSSQ